MLSRPWRPPNANSPHDILLLGRNLPSGLVTTLEVTSGTYDLRTMREWLANWLERWLNAARTSEYQLGVSYAYALVTREPTPEDPIGVIADAGPVAQFGYGTYPNAPEEWPEAPLVAVILGMVTSLQRSFD